MPKLFGRDTALAGSLIVVVGLLLAEAPRGARSASVDEAPAYKWNVAENGMPLLVLRRDRLQPGFPQTLTYPVQGACSA